MSRLNRLVFIIMASALEHSHTPEGVRERLAQGARVSYLRDWIYGAIDGGVTTFAIVAESRWREPPLSRGAVARLRQSGRRRIRHGCEQL